MEKEIISPSILHRTSHCGFPKDDKCIQPQEIGTTIVFIFRLHLEIKKKNNSFQQEKRLCQVPKNAVQDNTNPSTFQRVMNTVLGNKIESVYFDVHHRKFLRHKVSCQNNIPKQWQSFVLMFPQSRKRSNWTDNQLLQSEKISIYKIRYLLLE